MNELQPLKQKLDALIAQLSPQKRKALSREIGRKLAQSQRQRIARQQNPDGSAYAPRKTGRLKQKAQGGKLKSRAKSRAMFSRLRTARLMRTSISEQAVEIGYQGRNAQIARIHQFGLRAKVSERSDRTIQYEQRVLLGFTDEDLALAEQTVLRYLSAENEL